MSKKKSTMVLGYTRTGYPVVLPTQQTPDVGSFVNWTPGDHVDAARILVEHGERETDPVGSWCAEWAGLHREIGKSARRPPRTPVRGAAETTIRIGRLLKR